MRYEQSYPAPISGVSTLAPRNRVKGQAGLQENFRSDPVNKLTRRPSLAWDQTLLPFVGRDIVNHNYSRAGTDYRIIIDDSGIAIGWVNGVSKSVVGSFGAYFTAFDEISLNTVNDTTFVSNPTINIEMSTDTDNNVGTGVEKVSHINIVSAMNYSESLTVGIKEAGGTTHSVVYTIPALGVSSPDYDAADAARATARVASELQTRIAAIAGITCISLGSSVALWKDDGTWLDVTIATGQGDRSAKAINQRVEVVDGLPLYAVHGTRITVRPNPVSDRGTYFLEATGTSDLAVKAPAFVNRILEEVVWVESRDPDQPHSFNPDTMPHTIRYDPTLDRFQIEQAPDGWNSRRTGDDDSCPVPNFVGKAVKSVAYFQKRLVFLAGDELHMTETDDIFNWWKASAVNLLVSDPVSVSSSVTGVEELNYITVHNKDLLVFSPDAQFKIAGEVAVTPQTVSMPLVSSYASQSTVPPLSLGAEVYFPFNNGDSSGIQEYTGRENTTEDHALSITPHVTGYLQGEISVLTGSANLSMIAVKTTGSALNEIFVYEQFKNREGQALQQSWSKWILPVTTEVIDMDFKDDRLDIICQEGGRIQLKSIRMYSNVAVNTEIVFLDDYLVLDSATGDSVTLPTGYLYGTDVIVVRGDGTEYPLNLAAHTFGSGTLTFTENISGGTACKVYVGRKFTSRYRPTRPFITDEEDIVVTTDSLRINRYLLDLVKTQSVSMATVSDYYNVDDVVFDSRLLNNPTNVIGTIPVVDASNVVFPFHQDASIAEAEFYTDGYLGLTIAGIAWAGQYHKTSRRLR
jgi:hypothetical protein